MIGSDPKYQAIIDAYKSGQLATTTPQYNPIYDIRSQQIAAGELPAGSQFPIPQLVTTPTTETPKETFDPCPPGYQLVDGVCQPDTMFQQDRGGNDKEPYTGPKITNGIIEGYEQILSPGSGALNSMEMMELEKRFGPEIAKEMGLLNQKYRNRGVQYNPETGRFVAISPKLGQLAGDIGGAVGSMFGGLTDAAMNYLGSGGLLGTLLSPFKKKSTDSKLDNIVGSGQLSEAEVAKLLDILNKNTQQVIQNNIIDNVGAQMSDAEAQKLLDVFKEDTKIKTEASTLGKMVKEGTGSSGAPGRNYSTPARTRAAQAASKLGTTLATRGR